MALQRTRKYQIARKPMRRYRYKPRSKRAGLKDELDRLTSLIVRKRDKACVLCGRTDDIQAGHLYSRRYLAIRWDLKNVNAQCSAHNILHNEHPHLYMDWFQRTFSEDALIELSERRWRAKRFTDEELKNMVCEYRKILATT